MAFTPFLEGIVLGAALLSGAASAWGATTPAEERLRGAWFDPGTSGQGLLLDLIERPEGGNLVVGSWYTYTLNGGRKLWLTMSGVADPTASVQRVRIYHVGQNGSFGQPPDVSGSNTDVGSAELEMSSSGQMFVRFSFSETASSAPWPETGSMALSRIAYADPASLSIHQLATTGLWYDPSSSGQGLNATAFPATDGGILLVMSWFTYSQDRSEKIWLTLSGPASARASHLLDIYQTENGRFNQPPAVRNNKVGVATVNVVSANHIRVSFAFDRSGPWGTVRQGELTLTRLGAAPAFPGVIDTTDRAKVVEAYRTRYLAPFPPMQWTGNVAACHAGTTSLAFQQRVIEQVNFFRGMAGFSGVELRPNDAATQQAALIMDANNALSHTPPASWRCFTQAGADAAFASNLWLSGGQVSRVVDTYLDDFGDSNFGVGHRLSILSSVGVVSTGDTPRANALGIIAGGGVGTREFTAWPPAGFVPYEIMPRISNRWSFTIVGAALGAAVVSMRNAATGQAIEVRREPAARTDTAVWQVPNLVPTPSVGPLSDQRYEVAVTNVRTGSTAREFAYHVTLIDSR